MILIREIDSQVYDICNEKVIYIVDNGDFWLNNTGYLVEYKVNGVEYNCKFNDIRAALNCYDNMDHNFLKFL